MISNAAGFGGGAYGSTLLGCTLTSNSAGFGGGAGECALSSCTLNLNLARVTNGWSAGGGAFGGTLNNCTLTGNSASRGGGVSGIPSDWETWIPAILNNCTLSTNSADRGGGACGSTLKSCVLTSNSALVFGGGACQSTLSNCALNGNLAGLGGGDFQGTLDNCILTGNSATNSGGAAAGSTLDNCTLTGNSADSGGGAADFTRLNNCVAYFNTAAVGANYSSDWNTLNYCCTAPMPANGIGNITNAPLFVDYAGGNLRLQSNSPCINAGDNAYAPDAVDLDDQSRIVSGTVDMGAYEYQGPGSVISYAWLQQFGLPTDGSADAADLDLDGHTTWQEWRCLTDPTNALSALRLVSASRSGTNIVVSWQSVEGVSYFLERATNVAGPPSNFTPLASDIPGQPGTTIYTNTDAAAAQCKPLFYRVGTK